MTARERSSYRAASPASLEPLFCRKKTMSKKKKEGQALPFRIGLGSSKPPEPMTFDDAMDVLMDPANLPPKPFRPPAKGAKGAKKPRKPK